MSYLQKFSNILLVTGLAVSALVVSSVVLNDTAEAKAGSTPLGDLTRFEKLGKETLRLVESKNFASAKTKITELETAWDKAEENLRAKDGKAWRYVDKSIDKALERVRSDKPDQKACKEALNEMLVQMDSPGTGKN
ncbi:MAG: histidine kinase [bacterium]